MGSSTACGHYVAHVFKGGRWVIFNDEKVTGFSIGMPFASWAAAGHEHEDAIAARMIRWIVGIQGSVWL